VLPPQPPYALAVPEFRFRGLAALAGRAPLGGEREVALAVLMAARLAAGMLAPWPPPLPTAVRAKRATAARAWFASLTLQPALRMAILRVVDASAAEDPTALAGALRVLTTAAAPYLDTRAAGELRALSDSIASAPKSTS
jgi:hypothetical protein